MSPSNLRESLQSFDELSVGELYAVLQLRAAVFVVEQECAYQDLDGLDQASLHFGLWSDAGALLAYTRLLPPGLDFADSAAIGRVISAPTVRRTGLGRRHFAASIKLCERLWPGAAIRLHAQSYLLDFYAGFGFVAYGEEFLEDGLPHRYMVRHAGSERLVSGQ